MASQETRKFPVGYGSAETQQVPAGHDGDASVQSIAVAESLDGLAPAFPDAPASVLEVGCGRGVLASQLARRGFGVTGLEPDPEAADRARQRGLRVLEESVLDHTGGPYDVVLFTRSLHHIYPLDGAVRAALALLNPGGMLLAEEFGRERVDAAAASFFYDHSAVLAAAGVLEHVTDNPDVEDPLRRWQADMAGAADEHGHELHTSGAIVDELRRQAELVLQRQVPYLWRHIVRERAQEPDPLAVEVAGALRAAERRRVAEGTLPAVGLLLAARRRD